MNYGKKFLSIIMAAAGMMILITGWAWKTGYFPGHSQTGSYFLMIFGAVVMLFGFYKMHQYK